MGLIGVFKNGGTGCLSIFKLDNLGSISSNSIICSGKGRCGCRCGSFISSSGCLLSRSWSSNFSVICDFFSSIITSSFCCSGSCSKCSLIFISSFQTGFSFILNSLHVSLGGSFSGITFVVKPSFLPCLGTVPVVVNIFNSGFNPCCDLIILSCWGNSSSNGRVPSGF